MIVILEPEIDDHHKNIFFYRIKGVDKMLYLVLKGTND
jgi:hypothetical protein